MSLLTPRYYQNNAVTATREALRQGHKAVLLVAPTGAGKTFIACMIIKLAVARGSRVLFLAHREELITQTSAKLTEFEVSHGIIKAGFGESPYASVQVASVQSFRARAERLLQGYDLIIHDEAHRAVSEEHQIPRRLNPNAIAIGLTATPCRLDGQGLKGAFDHLIEVASVQELVDQGHLVSSRVFKGPKIKGLEKVHKQAGDYKADELSALVNTHDNVKGIVREWMRIAWGRPTVCFGSSVEHSKALCAEFNVNGIIAVHVDGTLKRTKEFDERAAAFSAFNSRRAMVLCNCGICTEGWDAPFCSCGIGARPTLSLSLYLQMFGRILRTCQGKKDALWLDFGNTTDTHGFVTDPHHWTLDGLDKKSEEKQKTLYKCKKCGAQMKSRPRYCPSCGVDTQPAQMDLMGGIDSGYTVIEIKPEEPRPKPKPQGQSLQDILFLKDLKTAKEKGYKPGWAFGRYSHRTGRKPSAELVAKSTCKIKTEYDPRAGKEIRVWAE
jgi:DNA repair protein RadD